jgi:hypothetical protein
MNRNIDNNKVPFNDALDNTRFRHPVKPQPVLPTIDNFAFKSVNLRFDAISGTVFIADEPLCQVQPLSESNVAFGKLFAAAPKLLKLVLECLESSNDFETEWDVDAKTIVRDLLK